MNHPEIAKIGLGGVDMERLKRSIDILVEANALPRTPKVTTKSRDRCSSTGSVATSAPANDAPASVTDADPDRAPTPALPTAFTATQRQRLRG